MSLARFDTWVRATMGPAAAGAQVYILSQPAVTSTVPPTPQVQLYADSQGVTTITQPLVCDGFGHAYAYVANGAYTVAVVFGGIVQQVYADQAIGVGGLTLPATFTPQTSKYLVGYNSTTGTFTAQQPIFADLSDVASPSQLPAMVGDSGLGGVQGVVPAPPAGSAAAFKYLGANGVWAVPSGTGIGISSVGLTTNSAFLTVANSPLTSNGTITINLTTGLTANYVLATPDSATGTVSARALVSNDIPNLSTAKLTSGVLALARGGNTFALIGDIIYGGVAAAPAVLSGNTAATRKFLGQTGNGTSSAAPAWTAISTTDLPSIPNTSLTNSQVTVNGDGTVLSSSGPTIALGGSGSLALNTQAATYVLAGPTSGPNAAPTFRALASTDIPALAYLSSSTVLAATTTRTAHEFMGAYSAVTGAFSFYQPAVADLSDTPNANTVLAGPTTGSAATATFRALVAADLNAVSKTVSLNYVIDGGGAVPGTAQSYGQLTIPVAFTITKVILTADQSGSCQLDLKYCTNATFPGSLTSLVASDPPNLSSQQISTDSTLTGWTTSLAANSQVQFYLTSATTVTRINVTIIGTVTVAA